MTSASNSTHDRPKWLYPVAYALLLVLLFLPVLAERPFAPQDTQQVIVALLQVAIDPYRHLAPIFHLATVLLIVLIALRASTIGRTLAAYIGLNYLVIALAQSFGRTEAYGLVLQTGALISSLLLGIVWIRAALRATLVPSFRQVPPWRYGLLPLALLAFWAPYNAQVRPDFDPLLLLNSADYGLTFCFTTPVFLFLLILFYPQVDPLAYRLTAFNGLLYGLINMTHFFDPALVWMGVLHLPLLILSLIALLLPRLAARRETVAIPSEEQP